MDNLRFCGATHADGPVVAGLYRFKDTYGVPLVYLIDTLSKHGKIVCLTSYVWDGILKGRQLSALHSEIEEALSEKYGRQTAWMNALDELFAVPIQQWPSRWPEACPL